MKIHLEQQNIGAAVMQIAEHEKFTAINSLKFNNAPVSNAFVVNHDTAVICKYATEPNANGEYTFTFLQEHMEIIKELNSRYENIFFGLVCVKDGEICCLSGKQFNQLIEHRRESADGGEAQYVILITARPGSSFRAYVNAAGKRGKYAGDQITIARKAFPELIFS